MSQLTEARLLVISTRATLPELEEVLGESTGGGCSLGASRSNGLLYKHSNWVRSSYLNADQEFLEDCVDGLLNWLDAKKDALRAVDPEVFCKVYCRIDLANADELRDGFSVKPQMSKKLADLDVLLLLDLCSAGAEGVP